MLAMKSPFGVTIYTPGKLCTAFRPQLSTPASRGVRPSSAGPLDPSPPFPQRPTRTAWAEDDAPIPRPAFSGHSHGRGDDTCSPPRGEGPAAERWASRVPPPAGVPGVSLRWAYRGQRCLKVVDLGESRWVPAQAPLLGVGPGPGGSPRRKFFSILFELKINPRPSRSRPTPVNGGVTPAPCPESKNTSE